MKKLFYFIKSLPAKQLSAKDNWIFAIITDLFKKKNKSDSTKSHIFLSLPWLSSDLQNIQDNKLTDPDNTHVRIR